ncbi:hypothetical protein [Mycobacterium sp.]|uniref:hypothetical protein n=1 Tax=Mycobacterium sp. TaxID=1785 RepID=UPI003BB00E81
MDEFAHEFGTDDAQGGSEAAMKVAAAALARGDVDEAETRYLLAADSTDPQVRRQAETALESMDERARAFSARGDDTPLNDLQKRVISLPQRWVAKVPHYYPMGFGDGENLWGPQIYDWQPHVGDPMINAPRTNDRGGVVYFGEEHSPEAVAQRLSVLFDVLDVQARRRDYTVVWKDYEYPRRDGLVTCLRVITRDALEKFDRDAAASVPDQFLEAGELVLSFVLEESRRLSDAVLTGVLGGDGDWAYEQLAFGIMMENVHYQVYRIWSRLWLLTK